MLTMNLADDCWKVPNRKIRINYSYNRLPCRRRGPSFDQSPKSIRKIYDLCCQAGYSGEDTIKLLIKMFVPTYYFHPPGFRDIQKTIGMIGHRGSGKTNSAVNVVINDWLIRGKPVWSNVDISVRVCYRQAEYIFMTRPLQKMSLFDLRPGFNNGCILIDEVNAVAADSSKFSSNANLAFANFMQQIRKLGLSVVYTVQGWNWVDPRLRFQTDYVVECQDQFLKRKSKRPGQYCYWTTMDISGMTGLFNMEFELSHKYITQYKVDERIVFNEPYWDAFDTLQVQGNDGYYVEQYRDQRDSERVQERLELSEARNRPAAELAREAYKSGVQQFYADSFWKQNGITDPGQKAAIGRELARYFERRRDGQGRYFYELKKMVVEA